MPINGKAECCWACPDMYLTLKIAPSLGRSGPTSNKWFLGPTSPQPKRDIDRFSHFCTAHVSLTMQNAPRLAEVCTFTDLSSYCLTSQLTWILVPGTHRCLVCGLAHSVCLKSSVCLQMLTSAQDTPAADTMPQSFNSSSYTTCVVCKLEIP